MAYEPLPAAVVANYFVSSHAVDRPSEAIISRIRFAVVEREYGPDSIQAGLAQKLCSIEGFVPFGQVQHVKVEGAVGGGIERRRYPGLVSDDVAVELVARSAVGNNIRVAEQRS